MNSSPRRNLEPTAHRPEDSECGLPETGLLFEPKHGVREAAAMLKLGQTTLRRLIGSGEIPVVKIGSKLLLLERDMERFLNQRHVVIQPAPRRRKSPSVLPDSIAASELLRDL